MEGNFFGTLTPAEIEKKARKWRQGQKKRFNEKRRMGGGGGLDMGKAVSLEMVWRVVGVCGCCSVTSAVADGVEECRVSSFTYMLTFTGYAAW